MATTLKQLDPEKQQDASTRRPNRAAWLIFIMLLTFSALSVLFLETAWQETQRREAFLPQLEAMAQKSPSDGRLLALLGGRLIEAGEYSTAVETLRRALVAGDQDEDVWLTMAAARAAQGNSRFALADFELALRAHPDSPALQVVKVRIQALGKHQTPNALAKAICPEGPTPLIRSLTQGSELNGLADWWGQRHPRESGFTARESAAKLRPDDAETQRLWGMALLQNRRLPEASVAFSQAVLLAPRSPEANLAIANLLEDAGEHSKAVLQYITCLKLRPDWIPAVMGLGQSSLNAKMTKYALQSYQRATEIAPRSAEAWIGLGRAGATLWTHHSQSLSAFETAARLAPERTDFFNDYAIALREDGIRNAATNNYQAKAISILRRRIAEVPTDSESHYLLANILLYGPMTSTVTSEAEAETRKALDLSPGQTQAEIQLAKLLLTQGNLQGTITLLTNALEADPDNAPALTILAQAYSRSGQTVLAKPLFDKVEKLNEMSDRLHKLQDREESSLLDATLHEKLATLYLQTGKPDRAYAERNMAQLIRKNPQEAAKQMTSLQNLIQSSLQTH